MPVAARWGLTPPSSGRPKGRFAPFAPPLMSNVRQHKGGNMACDLRSGQPLSLLWQRSLPFVEAHLNRHPGSLASACYESQLEAASFLLPSSDPHIPGVCWFPAAVRSTSSHEAGARAISASREKVRKEALLARAQVTFRAHFLGSYSGSGFTRALAARLEGRCQGRPLQAGLRVSPNPSIERTFQRPLRALWPAAHVKR